MVFLILPLLHIGPEILCILVTMQLLVSLMYLKIINFKVTLFIICNNEGVVCEKVCPTWSPVYVTLNFCYIF